MNYERCLRPDLRDRVATLEIRDFAKLANKVRIAEETLRACKVEGAERIKKRGVSEISKGKGEHWNKKQKMVSGQSKRARTSSNPTYTQTSCNTCGRNHGDRPCRAGQNVCYIYGKPGHFAK